MKTSLIALASSLVLTLTASAFAAPLSSVMDIGAGTDIRIRSVAQTGSMEGVRAAAIAGTSVVELKFVGMPTNAFLEDELDHDGYEMANLLKLYSDENGIVWAFVESEEEEEPRRVLVRQTAR